MGEKPKEDGVERLGEPRPENEWKDGVEDEWARPPPPPGPGMNSATLLTAGTLTFLVLTPSRLSAATLLVRDCCSCCCCCCADADNCWRFCSVQISEAYLIIVSILNSISIIATFIKKNQLEKFIHP